MIEKGRRLVLLLLTCVAFAQGQQTTTSTSTFKISLPLNINPESVIIEAGIYGRGLSLRGLQTRAGVHDYSIDLKDSSVGSAQSLKLLIYIPGYRMVAREFKDAELQTGRAFIPPLVELVKTVARAKLVDSSERPLPNQTLNVTYFLNQAMTYFGYLDGRVPVLPICTVKTDSNGEFTLTLPSFGDDPFFNGAVTGRFQLSGENGFGVLDLFTFKPNGFEAQKVYEYFVVRKIQKGTLRGRLGREFFQQNNLSPDLRAYVRRGDTIPTGVELWATRDSGTGFNADLRVDGSFDVQLPAGSYDLELWVSGIEKRITVQNAVIVEENKSRVVEHP